MQTLAAYLIQRSALNPHDVRDRSDAVSTRVDAWLRRKGITDLDASDGSFNSLTANSTGQFARKRVANEMGMVEELRLEEPSRGGQAFITAITKVLTSNTISIFATLSVRNDTSVIAPVTTDPRCPALIREILDLYPDWSFGGAPIGAATPKRVEGTEEATLLLEELLSPSRPRPIIVVSENEGEFVWPRLPDELAYDLAGLARVVSVDEEASWLLTQQLGKRNSCYLGAVRLYWPVKTGVGGDPVLLGTVWTASSLLSLDHDGKGCVRFRSTLRRSVMSVAALTVEPPAAIRQVQSFQARKRLQELEAKADANSEELELARLYIEENEELKTSVAELKAELSALTARAETAEFALEQVRAKESPEGRAEQLDDDSPVVGEVRYYKKTHSKAAYDVLVRVTDCGHTSWQNAAKADKARKGVERLEGRSDWKNMQHCGSCTGGGLWRVRW